jgi:hypothetical protein
MDTHHTDAPDDTAGSKTDSAVQDAIAKLDTEITSALEANPYSDEEAAADLAALIAALPADLRDGYPANAGPLPQLQWLVTRLFKGTSRPPTNVPVPATDTRPPAITSSEPDISGLSPVAKIARGYK